jgi:hypothetical protein
LFAMLSATDRETAALFGTMMEQGANVCPRFPWPGKRSCSPRSRRRFGLPFWSLPVSQAQVPCSQCRYH